MVTGVSALLIGALSVGLATAAQATHDRVRPPGQYLAKVTVRPGQTPVDRGGGARPDADTRVVIQQIQQLNSLSGDQLLPGEVLWVPRG